MKNYSTNKNQKRHSLMSIFGGGGGGELFFPHIVMASQAGPLVSKHEILRIKQM